MTVYRNWKIFCSPLGWAAHSPQPQIFCLARKGKINICNSFLHKYMLPIGCQSSCPGFEWALANAQNSGAAPVQLCLHLSVGIANKVYTEELKTRALWKQGWAKLVLIALERYSVALKCLTFNLRQKQGHLNVIRTNVLVCLGKLTL